MKFPKKYGYVLFCVIIFAGGYVGNWVGSLLGGILSPLGLIGGLITYAIVLYPTYMLIKRTESEW